MPHSTDTSNTLLVEDCYLNANWQDFEMDFHTHGFLEINYILEGSYTFSIAGQIVPVRKPNLILIRSSTPHRKIFNRQKPCAVLGCSYALLPQHAYGPSLDALCQADSALDRFFTSFEDVLIIENAQSMLEDMKLLFSLYTKTDQDYYRFIIGNKIMLAAARLADTSFPSVHKYIAQVKFLVESNYYRIQCMDDVAGEVHLNKSYLERLFRQETGQTLWQYVLQVKLEAAQNLLTQTNIPVGEIDSLVGIHSRQAFYIQFKKKYGVSPQEYRKQSLIQNPNPAG